MRKAIVGTVMALGLLLLAAGDAWGFDCYVANKPVGAGAVTEEEIRPAGNSGNLIAPGAFLTIPVPSQQGEQTDIFIRGGTEHEAREESGIAGLGSLPAQPHCRGSATNGVQTIDPGKC